MQPSKVRYMFFGKTCFSQDLEHNASIYTVPFMNNQWTHLPEKRQAQMLCKVTHCAWHVSTNTRPHQLCWAAGVTGRWGQLSHAVRWHTCYILTWQSFWSERRKGVISSYTPCSVNAAVNWARRSPGQCFQKLTTRAATILWVALFPASICLRPSDSCVRGLSLSPWQPTWEASNPSAL